MHLQALGLLIHLDFHGGHDAQLKQLQWADAVAVTPIAKGFKLIRAQQGAHNTLLFLQVGRQVFSTAADSQIQALRRTEGQNHYH